MCASPREIFVSFSVLSMYVSSYYHICVLVLIYVCPYTMYVSSYYYVCVLILLYVSSCYYICVLILLYMCPHTTKYVSSYVYSCYNICVLMKSACVFKKNRYVCLPVCLPTTKQISMCFYLSKLIY